MNSRFFFHSFRALVRVRVFFLIPPPTILKKSLQKILSSNFSSKCRLKQFVRSISEGLFARCVSTPAVYLNYYIPFYHICTLHAEKSSKMCECEVSKNCYYLFGKGGYVFGSVGLSVCLFVCGQHYSKSYEWIGMKFYGGVLGSMMKN